MARVDGTVRSIHEIQKIPLSERFADVGKLEMVAILSFFDPSQLLVSLTYEIFRKRVIKWQIEGSMMPLVVSVATLQESSFTEAVRKSVYYDINFRLRHLFMEAGFEGDDIDPSLRKVLYIMLDPSLQDPTFYKNSLDLGEYNPFENLSNIESLLWRINQDHINRDGVECIAMISSFLIRYMGAMSMRQRSEYIGASSLIRTTQMMRERIERIHRGVYELAMQNIRALHAFI